MEHSLHRSYGVDAPGCRLQRSTLGSAYSDTTAVTSCSRRSQYV